MSTHYTHIHVSAEVHMSTVVVIPSLRLPPLSSVFMFYLNYDPCVRVSIRLSAGRCGVARGAVPSSHPYPFGLSVFFLSESG